MNTTELILSILSGGMLGIIGQGIRIAVGLKKLSDSNTANLANKLPQEEMTTSRIFTSIFIGFVAGALAMIIKDSSSDAANLAGIKDAGLDKKIFTNESIVTVIAIGYAGADFIEGVFNTYISKVVPATTVTTTTSTTGITADTSVIDNGTVTTTTSTSPQNVKDWEDEFVG